MPHKKIITVIHIWHIPWFLTENFGQYTFCISFRISSMSGWPWCVCLRVCLRVCAHFKLSKVYANIKHVNYERYHLWHYYFWFKRGGRLCLRLWPVIQLVVAVVVGWWRLKIWLSINYLIHKLAFFRLLTFLFISMTVYVCMWFE